MSPPNKHPPEHMWWCFICNGGIGVWGGTLKSPPPRCPECHGNQIAPLPYTTAVMVDAIREGLRQRLINTRRFTGADRGVVMDYFDRAALTARKEGP